MNNAMPASRLKVGIVLEEPVKMKPLHDLPQGTLMNLLKRSRRGGEGLSIPGEDIC
jgi:hypothetical protein